MMGCARQPSRSVCRVHCLAVFPDDSPQRKGSQTGGQGRVWWHAPRRLRQPCRRVLPFSAAFCFRAALSALRANCPLTQISHAYNLVPKRWYAERRHWPIRLPEDMIFSNMMHPGRRTSLNCFTCRHLADKVLPPFLVQQIAWTSKVSTGGLKMNASTQIMFLPSQKTDCPYVILSEKVQLKEDSPTKRFLRIFPVLQSIYHVFSTICLLCGKSGYFIPSGFLHPRRAPFTCG